MTTDDDDDMAGLERRESTVARREVMARARERDLEADVLGIEGRCRVLHRKASGLRKARVPGADAAFPLSVFVIGLPLGVGLALIIGGAVIQFVSASPEYTLPLIGTIRAWQLTFLVVGLPGLLLAVWIMTLPEPVRRRKAGEIEQASIPATVRYLLQRWRAYGSLILGFSVLGMVLNVIQIWGVQYFVRELEVPLAEAGLRVGLAIGIFGTLGVLSGGWLTDRWRQRGHSRCCGWCAPGGRP